MTRKEALEYLKHRFMETGSPLNPSWESLEELKRHYGAIGIAISALEQQVFLYDILLLYPLKYQ